MHVIRNDLLSKKPSTILEKIEESLERLNDKIEVMIEIQRNGGGGSRASLSLPDASLDVMTLLSMPDHLRKTAMTICRCSRATADQRATALAKSVVGMLSQNSANGGRELRVSITVQNRVLSVGPLQLFEIPPVKWPAAASP